MEKIKGKTLASFLDLANHHPDAAEKDIKTLVQKVGKFGFNSAFVNPCYLKLARKLTGEKGKLGTVISFPLGQDDRDIKVLSAISAVRNGADELDVSMNVGFFKSGKNEAVLDEMKAVLTAARSLKRTILVKFIIEAGLLSDEEIKKASGLVLKAGADFVKTCSGWGPRGAEIKDVELIRSAVGDEIKIKVAGGIHTHDQVLAFLKAGADRIGTSKAVEIIQGEKK